MWFTETPWPPIVICFLVAILLFARWYADRRGVNLVGIGVLLVLSGAIYIAEQQIVTESERVEAAIYDLTSAFQKKDRHATLEHFAENAGVIRLVVLQAIDLVTVHEDLSVTDVKVTMVSNNSRAISRFRANATISVDHMGNVGHQPSYWELTWQREGGEWKIIKVRRLNPVNGDEVHFLAGSR